MKYIANNGWPILLMIIGLTTFGVSCSDMYEHEEYIEDDEQVYTGKIDSLTIYSGESRVLIEGLFISDPKITETRIYWDSKNDSVVVPIERTNRVDTLRAYIDSLQEGTYNFEIVTYDDAGNNSLPVHLNGEVFGQGYQSSLNNRPIVTNETYAGDLTTTVRFGSMDQTTGVFATEVRYMDSSDQEVTSMISIDNEELQLPDYKIGTEFEYRTLFLPEETSIDTFATEFEPVEPGLVYLKNTGYPFERSDWDGSRWGILADWVTNDDVKNANGYGGYEWRNETGVLSLEGGWELPEVPNGHIYQVVTLPPGQYTFEATGIETGDPGTKYLVVATGDQLPHVDDVPTQSMDYLELSDSEGTSSIEFQLTENTQVTVGIVGHMPDSGSWFKVHGITLTSAE